ncbi:MAG: hypothetical protein C0599_09440 [Salinivirgaceae bacterium]|nr:MAG: hypothetical protein C0599_09440 [Salinivirgaceae bacterium]
MYFRVIVLFSVVIFLGACNHSSDKSTDATQQRDNVYAKNHVKKMIQYSHDLAFIEPDNIGRIIQTTTFNKEGEEIKIVRYDNNGNICFTEEINPDLEKGKNKAKEIKGRDDSITVTNLNPEGKPIEMISHTYNDLKQIISTMRRDKDGVLVEKMTFEYYPNGLIKKDVYWNVELDKPEQIINYKYEYFN